jgi:hypothetical protein
MRALSGLLYMEQVDDDEVNKPLRRATDSMFCGSTPFAAALIEMAVDIALLFR